MEITHFKRHRPREKNLYNQVDWELRTKNQEKRQKTGIIILVNLRPESYREREKIFSSGINV